MSLNMILSLIGGFGIFWIVVAPSFFNNKRENDAFSRVSRITEVDDGKLAYEGTNFVKSIRKNGLAVTLGQAGLDVTPRAFTRTALMLFVGAAAAGVLLIGNPLAGLFIGGGAVFMYVNWLYTKRDKQVLEYEESLADMCDRLATGAMLTNNITGAVTHAAKLAPPIIQADFENVANLILQGSTVKEAFESIRAKRNSYALDMMVDTIDVWQNKGAVVPLAEVLSPLSETLRKLSMQQRMVLSKISGSRSQLLLTTIMPWGYVILLRSMMPGYRELFSQPIGTALLILAFCISAGGYLLGEKQVSILRQTMDLNSKEG